ncbi:glycoside hydrolase family 140 protein [Synoicihabitans lomoniglobus]|nr:glycoside hydrolase family 140 protein [Opitutaceae bacterium LMO-M01]
MSVSLMAAPALPRLQVSDNGRYLTTAAGDSFFWLGDTAWELFHRLDRAEIADYLDDRAGKRFNVVQAVLLAEADGLTVANREGELPFHDLDPTRPNEAYFALVDHVVREASARGIYLALLPTWGAHVEDRKHPLFDNMHVFTVENARVYGRFLGERYGPAGNIIWVLGGDRVPTDYEETWEAMVAGLNEGDPAGLMTYHVNGGRTSATYWHDAAWLDFNMIQSGHARYNQRNWEMVARDHARSPIKPTLDGEPNYEGLPVAFTEANPPFTDYDVRKAAYWSVFAGSFGHTYGHNSIWQMHRPGETKPILGAALSWREAMAAPGSGQLQHLRALMESRPFLTRLPDQSLIDDVGIDSDHLQATRDGTPGKNDATWIMVYHPIMRNLTVNTAVMAGDRLRCWWFDPRTGESWLAGEMDNPGSMKRPWEWRIQAGQGSPDWVFVIDDAAAGYGPPGQHP